MRASRAKEADLSLSERLSIALRGAPLGTIILDAGALCIMGVKYERA
jgi:hypothetical protein